MAIDHIRYDILAQEALRGVVRQVLADAAENGLPGEHHFYVSFNTRADGVRLSPRLLAQYPEEMTVILQHQFWDLVVTETGFEVGVAFGGIPERLAVPFAAVKGFFDPSVQFGLHFERARRGARRSSGGQARLRTKIAARPRRRSTSAPPPVAAVPAPANPERPRPRSLSRRNRAVRSSGLDRFRKRRWRSRLRVIRPAVGGQPILATPAAPDVGGNFVQDMGICEGTARRSEFNAGVWRPQLFC
jgi:hypothetical protein